MSELNEREGIKTGTELCEKCTTCQNYKQDCKGVEIHQKATLLKCPNNMKYKKKK